MSRESLLLCDTCNNATAAAAAAAAAAAVRFSGQPNAIEGSNPLLLRGAIVNGTYGIHKNLPGIYLTIFTNNFWSY